MIVWSLALILTLALFAVVYLPYRSTTAAGPTATNGFHDGDCTAITADVERVLRLWYCSRCGGRLDRLDQKVCSHCGDVVEGGGGA